MVINEFITTYGATILYSILTAIAGYIGIAIKTLYTKYIDDKIERNNDKTKKDVAHICVQAVNQIYKDLHGEEKLTKCIEAVSAMLCEKGITITEIEIRMLIEAAVNEFNNALGDVYDCNANQK